MGLFGNKHIGGILTGDMIRKEVLAGNIRISDFDESNLNPNSYNIHLGGTVTVYKSIKVFDLHDPTTFANTETYDIGDGGVTLRPGTLYLIPTREAFGSSRYEPVITGRSSIGRLGIEVHKEAGFGDIGIHGQWTLHVSVTYPTIVYANDPIAQVYFLTPYGDITMLYDGKYQGAKGAVSSRWGQSDQDMD